MNSPQTKLSPDDITNPKEEERPLKKTIFVGSSSKDKSTALAVAKKLTAGNIVGKCWTEEFPLGLLTFEALERMLRTCVGAVFIVSDENGTGQFNNNVMIEFGLVAGRMGRSRIALCTKGDLVLPSDLAGFTRIKNLSSPASANQEELSDCALQQLRDWAEALPVMCEGIPCTEIAHGYTGRWQVVIQFCTWRTKAIGEGDIAGMKGELTLHVPHDGMAGFGVLTGKVTLHWRECSNRQKAYTGFFHVCAAVSGAICQPDGSMTLRTQTFIRQRILETEQTFSGDALPEDLAMPWIFRWDMSPVASNPGLMEIKVKTELPENWTRGKGCAYKESMPSLAC